MEVEDEIVSEGTCRVLRIRRIGVVYFVENLQGDRWKVVAVSKLSLAREEKTPRQEAHEWMMQANAEVLNMQRAGVPNGAPARGPGQGHGLSNRGPGPHL